MTNEEAITYGKRVVSIGLNDETQAFCETAIKALGHTSPCDLCRYNPPSSGDGKPCSMCPACSGGNEE